MTNLNFKILIIGALDTNCYLIWDKKTLRAIVIDPADAGDLISEEIIKEGLSLEKIILTHGHFDHILGLLELKLNFPQAKIMMHPADLFLLESSQKRTWHWLKIKSDPAPPPNEFLQAGDIFNLGKINCEVIHTPGHTPGSICLYFAKEKFLFSGDTLFSGAIGRTDFSYSNPKEMQISLKKLFKLPNTVGVFPGHGETTTIGREKS